MSIEIQVTIPLTATSKKPGKQGEEGPWGIIDREGTPQLRDTAPSGKFGTLEKEAGTRVVLEITSTQERIGRLLFPDAQAFTSQIDNAVRASGLRFDANAVKVTTRDADGSDTIENDG